MWEPQILAQYYQESTDSYNVCHYQQSREMMKSADAAEMN